MPLKNQLYKVDEAVMPFDYSISGQGNKRMVVVVGSETYNEMEKELLQKMMQAIQHDLVTDTMLLEVKHNKIISLSQIIHIWDNLILFGISPDRLGINITYQAYSAIYMDKKRVLYVDDLKTIGGNATKKKQLWDLFQLMFLKR